MYVKSVRVLASVGEVDRVELELVTSEEAAKILGYSESRIRQLADQGELIATKVGRLWFVYPQLIKHYR